jgi:hypothetical protein
MSAVPISYIAITLCTIWCATLLSVRVIQKSSTPNGAQSSDNVCMYACMYVYMYVCTRVGQRLALALRPLMIYCASPFD